MLRIDNPDPDLRRRGRLVALVLVGVALVVASISIVNLAFGETRYYLPNTLALASLLVLFLINRGGYVLFAGWLVVAFLMAAPFLFFDAPTLRASYVTLCAPVFLASFLLRPWAGPAVAVVLVCVAIVGGVTMREYYFAHATLLILSVMAQMLAGGLDRAYRLREHQALHDALTGLPNRALLGDRLAHALAHAGRREESLAVLFLDLDNFKVVNDSLGHEYGDRLLVEAAKRLRECLRAEDTLARLGGDEFVVLIEDVDGRAEASRVARRIARHLEAPIMLDAREVFVTVSIGIAIGEAGDKPADFLRRADLAMYSAKDAGRDDYIVFEKEMDVRAVDRLKLERDLRMAVEEGELLLHYQPIVSLASGRPLGFEALVRWEHPDRGLMLPGTFIPVAEETGAVVQIGRWVLQEACQQIKEWQDEHATSSDTKVSVNLSPRQFRDQQLVNDVARILRETRLSPQDLVLEITEGVFARETWFTEDALPALRSLGVGIAIDDFGTGHSTLARLKDLPVDVLKVDRSFVRDLGEDAGGEVLMTGILGLALGLGLAVVAEGVETAGQAERLSEMGCEIAQGFHFARPMPPREAGKLLAAGS